MAGYTDTPHNMEEITTYIITDNERIVTNVLMSQKCYFYDTCSFRRHSNLNNKEAEYLLNYIKMKNGIFIITRCILMELASHSGFLNQEYINYIKYINAFGIDLLVIFEEDLFGVLEVAFSTNASINKYLCWSVRMIKSPISTIAKTLKQNNSINDEVIKGKNLDNSGIFKRFFESVRKNKESGDNLGDELLAICLHLLSNLPCEEDGKYCFITDDKGAAGKVDKLFKETAKQYKGNKVVIFSTPKLVQILYRENILKEKYDIKKILSKGTDGNIVVLGTLIYDLQNHDISLSCDELVDLIMQPNGIQIIF